MCLVYKDGGEQLRDVEAEDKEETKRFADEKVNSNSEEEASYPSTSAQVSLVGEASTSTSAQEEPSFTEWLPYIF